MYFVQRNPPPTSEQQMRIKCTYLHVCLNGSKVFGPPVQRALVSLLLLLCLALLLLLLLPLVLLILHFLLCAQSVKVKGTHRLLSGWFHSQQSKAPARPLHRFIGILLKGLTMSTLTTASDVYSSGGGGREPRVTESTGINTHNRRHASMQHIEHIEHTHTHTQT